MTKERKTPYNSRFAKAGVLCFYESEKDRIASCLNRLFSHNLWDEPEGEIDSLLISARKQDDLFNRKGLTEKYVLTGII